MSPAVPVPPPTVGTAATVPNSRTACTGALGLARLHPGRAWRLAPGLNAGNGFRPAVIVRILGRNR